jgi:hypothetical protein
MHSRPTLIQYKSGIDILRTFFVFGSKSKAYFQDSTTRPLECFDYQPKLHIRITIPVLNS